MHRPPHLGSLDEPALEFMLRAPALVEQAVRSALARELTLRPAHSANGLFEPRRFARLTLEGLRLAIAGEGLEFDPLARHELDGAALAAAGRFLRSKLAARLAGLAPDERRAGTRDVDVSIVDEHGRRHCVRLEAAQTAIDRNALARAVAGALARDPSAPETHLHLFSLRDGKLRSRSLAAHGRALSKAS